MLLDFRVLLRKLDDLAPVEVIQEPGIDFPRELVEEVIQELDVDEHGRCVGKLVGYDVEESFRTDEIVLGTGFTTLGFQSGKSEFEDTQTIGVEGGMASYTQ